jgi:hypothetical protein
MHWCCIASLMKGSVTFVLPKFCVFCTLWCDTTTGMSSARPMWKVSSSDSITRSLSSRMCVTYSALREVSGRPTSMISSVVAFTAGG